MMATDSERRKAAAWLRSEIGNGHHWPGALTISEAIGVPDPTRSGWEGRLLGRLADLMEPPYPDAAASYKGWRAEVYDQDGVLASPSNVAADLVRVHADGKGPYEPKVRCVAEVKVDVEQLERLVHDAVVKLTGIDRDALLELADRMEEMAGKGACLTPDGLEAAASSIREALGVGK